MDGGSSRAVSGEGEKLPPPPPIPPNTVPLRAPGESSRPVVSRALVERPGLGRKGQKIKLLTNHFKVSVGKLDNYFYQYTVSMFYEDEYPMDAKGAGRKVIDILEKTYNHVLGGKNFAYDGEKTLFTLGSLPQNKHEFIIVLDDVSPVRVSGSGSPESSSGGKRLKKLFQSKTIKVVISFATRIPLQSIAAALRGQQSDQFQEAVRVLDVILRQNAAKNNCLLVRQSFFQDNPRQIVDLGGGVQGCRGIHASFRPTQAGLSLNMDVSTTIIVKPGPVLEFLKLNQDVRDAHQIDWNKAKRTLKNLRVKMSPSNRESKITGLSEQSCRNQTFMMKQRDKGGEIELTVYEYFVKHRNIKLQSSADFPCINVGKPKRPTYVPIELCSLVSLQRYTKALSVLQRSSLVEKSRQKPRERMGVLMDALSSSKYNDDRILRSSGISISSEFIQIDGRVLPAPKLLVGDGENFYPQRGRWNFNNKKLLQPVIIENWAIVNFSARCDINYLISTLTKCANMKGIRVSQDRPDVFEENPRFRRAAPQVRVNEMIKLMQSRLTKEPKFVLCILPERKNCDIYGPWKKKALSDIGMITQCIAPVKLNDQYMTNVLLKINAKLGGLNSLLTSESMRSLPAFSSRPTMIIGMDVSHGSPGRSDVPSVAAVVGSVKWPGASRYKALVRTQSPKVEMISCLFQPEEVEGKVTGDNGVIRQLLEDFYYSSNRIKPDQIIIFRDGVSESQFNQVLNIELDQIIKACELRDSTWSPKFTVIVAQKNHHTKFFQTNSPDNVPPGTVIDSAVCHPKNNDFYMCAHAGMIGTTRPTHYHVLHDEIGFSADDVQELVHSLSYVYQRSTTAISVVAPICYAHLAAAQVSQFVKFEDHYSESGSSQGGITSSGAVPVPQLPPLDKKVWNSMFFC